MNNPLNNGASWSAKFMEIYTPKEKAPTANRGNFKTMSTQDKTNCNININKLNVRKLHEIIGTQFSGKTNDKGNRLAICIFHQDTRASLSINLNTGLYKCFACGESGNSFHYYQHLHGGISFKQALADFKQMGVL